MRFPLHVTTDMIGYQIRQSMKGRTRYPFVLMLEPLYTCNLACVGCSIERHTGKLADRLPLETCLLAVDQCGAPTVSICGGEPTLYPELGELVTGIVDRKRHIYLCTNGLMLDKNVFGKIEPRKRLTINVHLDGMRETHDTVCAREGVFDKAIAMIREAKRLGYHVTTNTTVFKETSIDEIEELCKLVTGLGIDGLMVSPGYAYESVKENIFLTRQDIQQKFQRILELSKKYPLSSGRRPATSSARSTSPTGRRSGPRRTGRTGSRVRIAAARTARCTRASRRRPCGPCARARATSCAWPPGTCPGERHHPGGGGAARGAGAAASDSSAAAVGGAGRHR
jgi:hopanoid biosynthesis associated radical SAM protein HpnH